MSAGLGGSVGAKAPPPKKKKKPAKIGGSVANNLGKSHGTIVPVGGETPQGMYSGNTGKLIKAAQQNFAVAKRDGKGRMEYKPAFTIEDTGDAFSKNRNFRPDKFRYVGLGDALSGTPSYSRQYQDKITELVAREQNGDLEDSPWSSFKSRVSDVAPLKWAWSTFSSAVGKASGALEWYNEHVQNPYDHFMASAVTAANPRSSGFGDWSKSWEGTYGLDVAQAAAQNPLVPGTSQWSTPGNRPWAVGNESELGDTSGLTAEQKADAQRQVDERNAAFGANMDPANRDDHARIKDWSENTLLGKSTTFGLTAGYTVSIGDPAFVAGKALKAIRVEVRGANWLTKLGKNGAVALVDDAAEELAGRAGKETTGVRRLVDVDNLDDASKAAAKADDAARAAEGAVPDAVDDLAGLTGKQRRRAARTQRRVAARKESMVRQLDWLTKQDSASVIRENELVRTSTNADGWAGLLAKADNTDDTALLVKSMLGDQNTIDTIKATRAWLGDTVENMHKHSEALGEFKNGGFMDLSPTDAGRKLGQFDNVIDEKQWVTNYIDDLTKQDKFFAQLVNPNMKGALVPSNAMGSGGVSRFASVESFKLARATKKGQTVYDTRVIQSNPFAIPVRVIRWLGNQKPNNWVQYQGASGVDSAGASVKAWLQSTDQKIVPPQARAAYYSRFAEATAKGDDEVLKALDDIEHDIMLDYARHHGVKAGVLKEVPTLEKQPVHYTASGKPSAEGEAQWLDGVRGETEGKIYSDAQADLAAGRSPAVTVADARSIPHDVRNERQWRKDMYGEQDLTPPGFDEAAAVVGKENRELARGNKILENWSQGTRAWQGRRDRAIKDLGDRGGYYVDEDGALSLVPGFETQLAGARPMMDWNRFGKIADGTQHSLKNRTVDSALAINSVMQQLWRPLALLSFRYTLRNNFDAQLRMLAVTGAAAYDPHTIQAMGLNAASKAKKVDRFFTGRGRKASQAKADAIRNDLYSDEGLVNMRDALVADKDALGAHFDPEDLAAYDAQIASLERRLGQTVDDLGVMNAPKVRAGDFDVQMQGADAPGMLHQGPHNPIPGDALLDSLSADETASMIFSMRSGSRERAFKNALGVKNGQVTQADKNYFHALADFANNHLGASKLAKMRLSNVSDADFVKFVRSDPEGEGLRRFANQMGKNLESTDDVVEWYHDGINSIHKYFPDETIRTKILNGEHITADELKARQGSFELPDVVGTEIVAEHGIPKGNTAWGMYQDVAAKGYKALGSVPESNLARYPQATGLYKRHLAEQVQFHGAEYARDNMDSIVRQAQRAAIRDVKATQYTVERYSNLAKIFEPVAPFFQAQINSVRVWSKLIGNDPSLAARAAQLWNLTQGEKDIPVGEMANADVPVWSQIMDATGMSKRPEGDTTRVNLAGIWSVLVQPNRQIDAITGDPDGSRRFNEAAATSYLLGLVTPQFGGPIVSPAASEIYKATAAIENPNFFQGILQDVSGYLSPNGASNSMFSWEAAAPAVVRDAQRWVQAQNSDAFKATATAIQADRYTQYMKGGSQGPPPTYEESVEVARAVYAWDLAFHMTLPFGGHQNRNEFDPIRDEIKAMYDQGMAPKDVRQAVYEKFGFDYAPLMISSQNKFGGVPATMKAVKWLNANQDLVARYLLGADGKVADPDTASMRMYELKKLIPELQNDGSYDPKAASLLRVMDIPGSPGHQYYDPYESPDQMIAKQIEVQKGWMAHSQMDAEFDKIKAKIEAKYPNRNKKGDPDRKAFFKELNPLSDAREATVAEMRGEFPAWADEAKFYQDDPAKQAIGLGILAQLKADDKLYAKVKAANPGFYETVEKWLDFRYQKMVDIKRAGSTQNMFDWDAKADVKLERERYEWGTKQLMNQNTQFRDMFKSFFQQEFYYDNGPQVANPGEWVPRAWKKKEVEKDQKKRRTRLAF